MNIPDRTRSTVLLAIPIALALSACQSERRAADSSAPPEWTLGEPILSIGQDSEDADYLFSRVRAVRLLTSGAVVVADGSSNSIRAFLPDGALDWRAGRQGDGPGEFQYINELRIREPDTLAVHDSQHQRLTLFSSSGELLPPTVSFRADDGWPEQYLGRLPSGNHVLAWISQVDRDEAQVTPDLMRIGLFAPSGEAISVLATDLGMRRLASPVPFSGHFTGQVSDGVLYHGDGVGAVVRRTTSEGDSLPTLKVPIPELGVSSATRELLGAADSAAQRRIRTALDTPGTDTIPAYATFFVDRDQRLWVKRYHPVNDSHSLGRRLTGGNWVVLDRSGRTLATVNVPHGFRLFDVRHGLAAGVARDALDVERVEVRSLSVAPAS